MTKFPEIFSALAAPFDMTEVKVRPGGGGKQLHYISARTAMNRLDAVLGPENWQSAFVPWGEHSLICTITATLPDGTQVAKSDGGGRADMPDGDNDDKSAFSDSFKRAATQFGVARYLYRDGVPSYAAAGSTAPPPASVSPPAAPSSVPAKGDYGNLPRSGRALFAWAKGQEEQHGIGLIKYLNEWAKLKGLGYKMAEWDDATVGEAVAESVRKLDAARPPSAPVNGTANMAAPHQRRLFGLVSKAASIRFGTDTPTLDHFKDIVDMINHSEEVSGEVLGSIKDCTDVTLLLNACKAAERIVAEQSKVDDDIPF